MLEGIDQLVLPICRALQVTGGAPPAMPGQPPQPPSGPGKADLTGYQRSMRTLKDNLTARVSPQLRGAVSLVLDQQKRDIVSRVRTNFDALKNKPKDASIWWPPSSKWDDAMTAALGDEKVWALHQDADGGMWMGTRAHGLYR